MPHEITDKIDEVYGTTTGPTDDISELESELFSEKERDEIAKDFSGETFLRTLLDHTIQGHASSIHFEPKDGRVHLRFRTDSGIEPVGTISQGWFLVLGNRLNSLLDMMETSENFVEGFLSHHYNDRRFVFYTSIVKTPYGNSVTLLNLTPKDFADTFDDLPLEENERESILQLIGGRSGLVMIVGPGKIEKLKFIDLLLKKKHGDLKKTFVIGSMPWFTDAGYIQLKAQVEDKQHQLDRLKIAMSQDPDILYVEDAWNKQVLEYALQSAVQTTFVVTSFHFPDTLTALEYANESIENKTLLNQGLRGLIGVHIFRTLCPDCKTIDDNYAVQSRTLKMPRSKVEKKKIYKAVGCDKCHQRGYLGSRIVVETLQLDEKLGGSLKSGRKFSLIRDEIVSKGHRTIEQQAQDLVLAGEIGIDDLKNVERR
jgi:type II secretory ATPase GspE/PulE/Tfp pilus assembly ATPase PilB-like protein